MSERLTQQELLSTVRKALEALEVDRVWWLKFGIREEERSVQLHVSTVPRTRHDRIAGGAMIFDRYADKEYIVYTVRRFVQDSCGLGWALIVEEKNDPSNSTG